VATSDRSHSAARWLYSTKNIAGCSLGVIGPVLAAVGVLSPPLGLAIIPALYAIGALAAPDSKGVDLAAGIDRADVGRSLAEIQRRIADSVPPEVVERVRHISATVTETLPRTDGLGPGSSDLRILVRTATDYLPTTLQAYLDLPRAYADRHVVHDGKTSLTILCDQLDVLSSKLDEVADAVNRSDTDRLLANGRFLAEKFGRGALDLPRGPEPGNP